MRVDKFAWWRYWLMLYFLFFWHRSRFFGVSRNGSVKALPQFIHLRLAPIIFLAILLKRSQTRLYLKRTIEGFHLYYYYHKLMQSFKDRCRGVGVWFVRLQLGYKMFVLMTIACQIAGALVENWSENMVFNAVMVVEQFQFWRLFSSVFVVYELGVIPLLVTVFNLWICYICMPSLVLSHLS